jgi:peptide/nickel transport system permease protein
VLTYVLRKLLLAIPLLWGVLTLIFLLVEVAPGDAADFYCPAGTLPSVCEQIREQNGLNDPLPQRYATMLMNTALLDFGDSIAQSRPVMDVLRDALPNTLVLSSVTLLTLFSVGVLLGIVQAVRQYSLLDNALSLGSLILYSMPTFWFALMLQLLFSLLLGWLPATGVTDPVMYDMMSPGEQLWNRVEHLILPGVGLGLASAAGTARYMRSSMLEVVRQDYIRTAHAKGLPEWQVIFKHALRNAMLPIVTLIGLSMPALFSGAVTTEIIFGWPGMGRVIVSAIMIQDLPLMIGCFYIFTLLVVVGNLSSDLLYSLVDPRIRLE